MKLRHRILLYYSLTLAFSLMIVAYWSWHEFEEQHHIVLNHGIDAALQQDPFSECLEIILYGGVPAALLGLLAGALLVRQSLRPIETLTHALEKTNANNLSEAVPRSGNGDEMDRMAAVFNTMKSRLDASFTQARQFTLNASHELKTPLTIMHATLEKMLRDDLLPSTHREDIASMIEEVQRLSTIVGQLTFLAKADAGLLPDAHDPVSLDELVQDVAEDALILAAAPAISVTLQTCEPVTVLADRMRLRQLLLNLADNAVKHNFQGGSVVIDLTKNDDHAQLTITNTGTVLSKASQGRVFERFFRGEAAQASHVEGSGLGLSIAYSIAQAHGGTLTLTTIQDQQTRVTLTLPCHTGTPLPVSKPHPRPHSDRPDKRISVTEPATVA